MIPVYQTIFEPPLGDCWRACVASIMELRLEGVPNFAEWYVGAEAADVSPFRRYLSWCAERGWLVIYWDLSKPPANIDIMLPSTMEVMVTVKSPSGPWNHCVVSDFQRTRIIHDPCRGGPSVDLSTAQNVEIFVPAHKREIRRLARRRRLIGDGAMA